MKSNTLTNNTKHLLGDPDIKFTCLQELDLSSTNLSAADLQVLAEAVKHGRLPQLKKLDMGSNTLTACLRHLLGDPDVRFTSLEKLYIRCTGLSAADLQVLAEAVKHGRLPQLKKLDLEGNTLTNSLKHLLGDPDVRFTCLEVFVLPFTWLEADDHQVLAEAVELKLPRLKELVIPDEGYFREEMRDALKVLKEKCQQQNCHLFETSDFFWR